MQERENIEYLPKSADTVRNYPRNFQMCEELPKFFPNVL